jgi:hypothetical protein
LRGTPSYLYLNLRSNHFQPKDMLLVDFFFSAFVVDGFEEGVGGGVAARALDIILAPITSIARMEEV